MINNIQKYEYALDIFKGTCELNNYEQITFQYEEKLSKNMLPDTSNLNDKSYYHCLTFDKKPTYVFGAINKKEPTIYIVGEIINMASKVLYHLDVPDIKISLYTNGYNTEELVSNLETLDLEVETHENNTKGETLSFEISSNDKLVVKGGIKENLTYFTINYSSLENVYDYTDERLPLDAYIFVEDKSVLDDAFIIGSNLKDAGFKVEVDYSLKKVTKDDINACFLITFDSKDIENYQVKLIDMATEELKKVMIDNLVEELSFL